MVLTPEQAPDTETNKNLFHFRGPSRRRGGQAAGYLPCVTVTRSESKVKNFRFVHSLGNKERELSIVRTYTTFFYIFCIIPCRNIQLPFHKIPVYAILSPMKHSLYNLIAIVGPTASGKSDLAIALAKKYNGEIISADSRQVYRGMDVGTGKVPRDLSEISNTKYLIPNKNIYFSEEVRHHLIDVASPKREYNISHFLRDAKKAITDIESRGKMPIICGGTHFWIQALVSGQTLPEVKPNKLLRKELEKKSIDELFAMLMKKDSQRAKSIDAKNPYRLIRALEICEAIGKVPSSIRNSQFVIRNSIIIALNPDKEILRERIRIRLEKRFGEGMVEEVEKLRSSGISWKRLERFGLEYRYIAQFLQEKISAKEMKEKLFFEIWHYAKRQISWLRRWEKQGAQIYWVEKREEGEKALH